MCKQCDNICHLLTTCKKFIGLRRKIFKAARQNNTQINKTHLLTTPPSLKNWATLLEDLTSSARLDTKDSSTLDLKLDFLFTLPLLPPSPPPALNQTPSPCSQTILPNSDPPYPLPRTPNLTTPDQTNLNHTYPNSFHVCSLQFFISLSLADLPFSFPVLVVLQPSACRRAGQGRPANR